MFRYLFCMYFALISRASGSSIFSRDVSFDNFNLEHSLIEDKQSLVSYTCARTCHNNKICQSFVYNLLDRRCRLFNKRFFTPQSDDTHHGNVMFRKVEHDGVCEIPVIDKGRLLAVDGQSEGSLATFICDDFHFPAVPHVVCEENGTWTGLTDSCVYTGTVFSFPTLGRVVENSCVVVIGVFPDINSSQWPHMNLRDRTLGNTLLTISFRGNDNKLVWNSKMNNRWGEETRAPLSWGARGQEANLTLCIGESSFTFYIDGEERFNFEHRIPVADMDEMMMNKIKLKRIVFM